MTRKESKARDALQKIAKICRKQISKPFGWKQNDYLSWKIESGYYFSILHLHIDSVSLSVKPFFIDDLWWDIFEMPQNKKAPKSLRGNGAFAVPDIRLKTYPIFDTINVFEFTEKEINRGWEILFKKVEEDITQFISENPIPDTFCPTEVVCPVYALMMDIHCGNINHALERIEYYRSHNVSSSFGGPKGDAYDYIEKWCKKNVSI